MMTPLTGMISIAGSVCKTSSVPSATSECVACRMYQITAAMFMPLPTMDTVLAMKTSRSGLCCRIERILPHCNRKSAGLPTRALRIIRVSRVALTRQGR